MLLIMIIKISTRRKLSALGSNRETERNHDVNSVLVFLIFGCLLWDDERSVNRRSFRPLVVNDE